MDQEKIISGINKELDGLFGALIQGHVLAELSEIIFKTIKPDLCPKDHVSYHDVVKIVEQERYESPKMVLPFNEREKEKALNKIRDGLRKLKKS